MQKIELSKPPVVELVIGAQFNAPIFSNEFIYDYYQTIKEEFPKIQENSPLPFIIESTVSPSESRILQGFHSRRFFINKDGNKLLQLQPDRILFNWRKNTQLEEYPSFSVILNQFELFIESISKFIPDIIERINQLEVTFVDKIFIDTFGSSSIKLDRIFSPIKFSDVVKTIRCNIAFPHEEIKGNLIFDLKSGNNNADNRRILISETTCRGMKNEGETISEWYHRAHEILLDFFIHLFTDEAINHWV